MQSPKCPGQPNRLGNTTRQRITIACVDGMPRQHPTARRGNDRAMTEVRRDVPAAESAAGQKPHVRKGSGEGIDRANTAERLGRKELDQVEPRGDGAHQLGRRGDSGKDRDAEGAAAIDNCVVESGGNDERRPGADTLLHEVRVVTVPAPTTKPRIRAAVAIAATAQSVRSVISATGSPPVCNAPSTSSVSAAERSVTTGNTPNLAMSETTVGHLGLSGRSTPVNVVVGRWERTRSYDSSRTDLRRIEVGVHVVVDRFRDPLRVASPQMVEQVLMLVGDHLGRRVPRGVTPKVSAYASLDRPPDLQTMLLTGSLNHELVKLDVEVGELILTIDLARTTHLSDQLLQGVEVSFGEPGGGLSEREAFEDGAYRDEHLVDLRLRHAQHLSAPVRVRRHEPFLLELPQRLADRRTARAQLCREVEFDEAIARLQCAARHRVAEDLDDMLAARLNGHPSQT